jgi:hypothetical protein
MERKRFLFILGIEKTSKNRFGSNNEIMKINLGENND